MIIMIHGTYQFQWAATSIVEVIALFVFFDTGPNLLIDGHNRPAGAQ